MLINPEENVWYSRTRGREAGQASTCPMHTGLMGMCISHPVHPAACRARRCPLSRRERPDSKERCSPPQGHSGRVQGWGVLVTRGHGRGPGAGARQTCSVLGSPVRCGAS